MNNFWIKLKKPIYALAPLAGYTDSAFRQICKSFGADVVYSEMASATALVYNPKKTLEMLRFSEEERPYVVQLFGDRPEHFARASKLLNRGIRCAIRDARYAMRAPDGIDINFGCPVRKVAKQGAGAVLMDKPELAREIVKAVLDNTDLPVSVKIRSQVGGTDALKFLDYLHGLNLAAVMIHGRTVKQGFTGKVDAAIIKKARSYFNGIILANGGVIDYESATSLLSASNADGLGIARGALGRPWIFKAVRTGQGVIREPQAAFKVAVKQAQLVNKLKGEAGIIEMRKHLCAYTAGLPGAKLLREKLVTAEDINEVKSILNVNAAYRE
ncbi:MAG: tRNA-dihydrouridine synthase family protein [Planctomycetes bacterium]|jgi:tRNA-dihydrouridine synthase B|nr:tRNA-dihydrouridine synthase family protein [Planctomycetota bacterium]